MNDGRGMKGWGRGLTLFRSTYILYDLASMFNSLGIGGRGNGALSQNFLNLFYLFQVFLGF